MERLCTYGTRAKAKVVLADRADRVELSAAGGLLRFVPGNKNTWMCDNLVILLSTVESGIPG